MGGLRGHDGQVREPVGLVVMLGVNATITLGAAHDATVTTS